jgi:hypothetical protein
MLEHGNVNIVEKFMIEILTLVKILSSSGTESDIKQKQVKAFSLEESMKPETTTSLV